MNRLMLVLLSLAAAGGVGFVLWLTLASTPSTPQESSSMSLGAEGAASALQGGLQAEERGDSSLRSESAAVLTPDPVTGEILDDMPSGTPASTYVARAYLVGRIVDRAGKPITGMDLRLLGKVANLRRREAWAGDLSLWKHMDRRTDGQGRFAFAFRPLPPLEFTLETRDERFLTWRMRWTEIEPGSKQELGDIELSRGGGLKGRLTDQYGDAIAGGWEIELNPEGESKLDRIRRDPDSRPIGSYHLTNVPQGTYNASIRFRGGMPEGGKIIQQPEGSIEIKEGEEKTVLFTYQGPSLRTSITLDIKAPKTGEYPLAEHVRLVGGNAGVQIAGAAGESVSSFTWNDLSFTTYTLEVNDPRFQLWRKEGIKPSPTPVSANLSGSSTIKVKAYRSRDAKPVTFYGVKIKRLAPPVSEAEGPEQQMRRRMGSMGLEDITTLSRDKAQPGGVATMEGLVAGDWIIVVDSKEYTRGEVEVRGLAPGETREVEVPLAQGAYIAGTVMAADGKTPVPAASVLIEPYNTGSTEEDMMSRMASRFRSLKKDSQHSTTSTDENGRFFFDNMEPGTYTVRAKYELKLDNMLGMMDYFNSGGAGLVAEKQGVSAGNRERVEDVVLTLPQGAYFRGRLLAPPEADFKLVNLRLRTGGAGDQSNASMSVAFRVDEEGRFEVGPLRPGPANLTVILFDEEDMTSFGRMQQREVGEYILSAGDSGPREIDVRSIWPGKVRVTVTRDGKPIEGARVSLQELGTERRGFNRFTGERSNAAGVVNFDSVFAGELEVGVSKDDWTIRYPSPVFLAPGGTADVEVRVMLFPGTLEVVDKKSGAPLRDRSFFLREAGSGGFADRPLRTNNEGQITMELSAGAYELVPFERGGRRARGQDFQRILEADGIPVQWGSAGPSPAKVAFELEAESTEEPSAPIDTPSGATSPGGGGRGR